MRILVTGAGTGIGRATVVALAERGHEVVATARRPEVLADLPATLRLELDVTDDASVTTCIAAAGPVDALVNNAGITETGPLETFPHHAVYEELRRQWSGADDTLVGPAGRPGPELVGRAIADAVDRADTPLRVPVGADAEMVLAARKELSDEAFEAAMRDLLGLSW